MVCRVNRQEGRREDRREGGGFYEADGDDIGDCLWVSPLLWYSRFRYLGVS